VPGFPYLRSNRLLASFAEELEDPARFAVWIAALGELDAAARSLELRNLAATSGVSSSVDEAQLDRCRSALIERDQREMAAFEELFQGHVASHRWQKARDVARQAGHARDLAVGGHVPARNRRDERVDELEDFFGRHGAGYLSSSMRRVSERPEARMR